MYSVQPAQANLPPYSASLLSNGLAFNTIDKSAGGAWRLEGGEVVRHWQPGADRAGAPTATRGGRRLD